MNDPFTLITGASSGIGQAIAWRLSGRGPLILGGRDEGRLARTRAGCVEPDRHVVWPFDLDQISELGEAFSAFLSERAIRVESFVHSAGVVKLAPLRLMDSASVERVMNVNVLAAIQIVRVLAKKSTNHGALRSVVFISSIHGLRGVKGNSAYCASKGALDALTRCLALELAPATRVNAVAPGAVQTPMSAVFFEDERASARLAEEYPLGTGRVDDIVDAVEFLMSERARWITGQILTVDGGRTAC